MFKVVISVEGGVLLKKVVYFDENSATDYLVVKNGGALVQVDEDMAISINKMYDTLKLGKG